jgi:integrase
VVNVRGYLGKRGPGFEAVVDVPPSLRQAVGRKRLRKGLGTQDIYVANARLPKALLELNARIDAATRKRPGPFDPITQEAMALSEHLAAVKRGDPEWLGVGPQHVEAEDGELVEVPAAEVALDLLRETIQERAEAIGREHGESRARDFGDIAQGRITPLSFHMETWLVEPGPRGRRHERTKADYRSMVAGLGAWLNSQGHLAGVERVSRRVAGQYVSALHAKGLSAGRIRDTTSALSGYWQWMERKGIAAEGSNPWPRQAPRKVREEGPEDGKRAFTEAEVRALLEDTTDAALSDLMRVAALTGMRVEEICQLTVGKCGGGVFVVAGGKTAAAARSVPIHSDLLPVVERRCKDQPASAWLFPEFGEPNQYGKRSPNAIARFGRYRIELGVHEKREGQRQSLVDFHSWRRWFVTEALRAGQLERVVKQVVGHKLPKSNVTLGVYFGGDTPEAFRACVEAVRLPLMRSN